MTRKIASLAICAILGVFAFGCGAPEEKPDTSMIVDQSKAPAMDGSVGAEGAAPTGGPAAQKSDEGS